MPNDESRTIAEDVKTLHSLGYAQELVRRMSGFSNYAISLSIICILAGCITSFQIGFSSVGGAAIGLGWPLGCFISLVFALTMAQVASAFPTAGGLYHWAAILGGKGWGWATAWFNLFGLITVLAAINLGTYLFVAQSLGPLVGFHLPPATAEQPDSQAAMPADTGPPPPQPVGAATALIVQIVGVMLITLSQAAFNHMGIRVTTLLTDFSGYWILIVAVALSAAMLAYAGGLDFTRLVTFTNYSGKAGGDVLPQSGSVVWLFLLGLLLPAYTITGFDASAHTSEETIGASQNVPRGIVRSVVVSGVFGWLMLCAIVLAIPNMGEAAAQGDGAFHWIMRGVLPPWLAVVLYVGIAVAQYLCGLATVTSASRMAYAFARDGGLPFSELMRHISIAHRTPSIAVWVVSALAVAFTVYTPVYSTITAASVIFLYISYCVPTAIGLFAYRRTWTRMGPWDLGAWYRVLAVLCIVGCGLLIVIGVQPPNDKNLFIVPGAVALTAVVWFGHERHRFRGPPQGVMSQQRLAEIEQAERTVGGTHSAPL